MQIQSLQQAITIRTGSVGSEVGRSMHSYEDGNTCRWILVDGWNTDRKCPDTSFHPDSNTVALPCVDRLPVKRAHGSVLSYQISSAFLKIVCHQQWAVHKGHFPWLVKIQIRRSLLRLWLNVNPYQPSKQELEPNEWQRPQCGSSFSKLLFLETYQISLWRTFGIMLRTLVFLFFFHTAVRDIFNSNHKPMVRSPGLDTSPLEGQNFSSSRENPSFKACWLIHARYFGWVGQKVLHFVRLDRILTWTLHPLSNWLQLKLILVQFFFGFICQPNQSDCSEQ